MDLFFIKLSFRFLSTRVAFGALNNFFRSLVNYMIDFLFNHADMALLFSTRLSTDLAYFKFTVVVSSFIAITTSQVLRS